MSRKQSMRRICRCNHKRKNGNLLLDRGGYMPTTKKKTEDFRVRGEDLIAKVKEIVNEGNVRKITITDKDGKVLVTFPLTFGVVGVIIAPVLAAIGAIAALVTECTISVEREE